MNKSVLIVEDEKRMRNLLVDYFEEEFNVYAAADGVEALELFAKYEVDVVILDLMMPKLDGYSVCKMIREISNAIIIMLTAREEEEDKLLGFEYGADAYVTKPFSPKVLIARTNTLLKRYRGKSEISDNNEIVYGPIKIYKASRKAMYSNSILSLTNKEYELLLLFMTSKDIVLTRENIIDCIWGYDYMGDGRVIDTNVKTLRKKLDDHGKWISTVKGVGYKFEIPESEL